MIVDESAIIDYTHFSLALSSTRKLAYWVGWNIDGTSMQRLSRTGLKVQEQWANGFEDVRFGGVVLAQFAACFLVLDCLE